MDCCKPLVLALALLTGVAGCRLPLRDVPVQTDEGASAGAEQPKVLLEKGPPRPEEARRADQPALEMGAVESLKNATERDPANRPCAEDLALAQAERSPESGEPLVRAGGPTQTDDLASTLDAAGRELLPPRDDAPASPCASSVHTVGHAERGPIVPPRVALGPSQPILLPPLPAIITEVRRRTAKPECGQRTGEVFP